jgi:hypothetical protein
VLLDKARRRLARGEGRHVCYAPQERQVGRNPEHRVVLQRPAEPQDGRRPVWPGDDQLSEHRVVVQGDLVTGLNADVVADSGTGGWSEGLYCAACWQAGVRVLGVDARLDRGAARSDVFLRERQGLPRSDGELEVYEIQARQ